MFPENSNVSRVEKELVTATLDEIAGPVPAPTLLKIDVQGAEIEVLEGAERTLSACEVVQLRSRCSPTTTAPPR